MQNPYPICGHPVLDPRGQTIYLPQFALIRLRRMGLLRKRRGIPQISDTIYPLLNSEYASLMDGLQRVLGPDCAGPEWLICRCERCPYPSSNQTGD
jgi:hypothetical protein